MRIDEILKSDKISLSFEVFPPKTDSSFESVKKAVGEIAGMYPSFMSVTYGAGGGTSEYTLNIAKSINSLFRVFWRKGFFMRKNRITWTCDAILTLLFGM